MAYNQHMTAAHGQLHVRGECLPPRRFSSDDYLRMVDAGLLTRADHVELIDGIIVAMSPAGPKHNHVLTRLTTLLAPLYGRLLPSVQGTLILAEGEVYDPDFMLLELRPAGYKTALPRASDVRLLIEAADSSLRRDQQVKLPAYAAAGIADYWIADLERETILVHRQPLGDRYDEILTLTGDDKLSPLAAPDLVLTPNDVFT